MLRLSKLTDYGIMLLVYLANGEEEKHQTSTHLAKLSKIPSPTASKILKILAKAGLVQAHRGKLGGYQLARPATEITVADMIEAMEGPLAITECSGSAEASCELEPACPTQNNWKRINRAVVGALQGVTLADMDRPHSGEMEAEVGHYRLGVLPAKRSLG
ncbi:MAG: SUF system Fe-S cluster assembly regulator [Myxococcota bacterium]|nr:SUF system Fe-S cluster assembly regulator [Myxococcota bacterium]